MKEYKVKDSNIPVIEYNSIEDCYWDMSRDTKKYLTNFRQEKNKYKGVFTFFFRYSEKIIIVIRCNQTFIQAEAFRIYARNSNIYDIVDVDLNDLQLRPRVEKAIEIIKGLNGNRTSFTKRMFNKIVKLLSKSYHQRKILDNYKNEDVYEILYQFYRETDIKQYNYVKT